MFVTVFLVTLLVIVLVKLTVFVAIGTLLLATGVLMAVFKLTDGGTLLVAGEGPMLT